MRNALDETKTSTGAPIPMTRRWRRALEQLRTRGWRLADDDHVFTRDRTSGRPADEHELRAAFRAAVETARLKPIPMYNSRHSFGTALASRGVSVRTISGLMRHRRLSTTEIYMAYSPQADLAVQMERALEGADLRIDRLPPATDKVDAVLARLAEEIPPKWLKEVERVFADAGVTESAYPLSPPGSPVTAARRGAR